MYKNISVVVSTRKIKGEYVDQIRKTSGNPNIEILIYENNGSKSLAEQYNTGLHEAKNDIVVFCHDDLIFDTNAWASKLLKHFNNTDYGILGVAGTDKLQDGCWWRDRSRMYGIVNHQHNGKKHTNHYSEGFGNKVKPVIVVDGLFMAVCKNRILSRFNEFFPGFHFYDIPFCLDNHLKGVKVGVITDVRLTHLSIGQVNETWHSNLKIFNTVYKDKLPCQL